MRDAAALMVLVILLAGCASGIRALTPYTSSEIEQARARCLAHGGLWMESAEAYDCATPRPRPDEKT